MSETTSFARLISALRPWLGQIVVVGGWAHRLHRLHPLASQPPYPPLTTLDADIALSDREPLEGDIRAALGDAGFEEEFFSDPVSFIAQKLLIHHLRPRPKRAQDALYIHDTLELFGGELETLAALWSDRIRAALHEKAARSVVALCEANFGTVTDTLREAARIAQNRSLRPERLQETCAFGLAQIFGERPPASLPRG